MSARDGAISSSPAADGAPTSVAESLSRERRWAARDASEAAGALRRARWEEQRVRRVHLVTLLLCGLAPLAGLWVAFPPDAGWPPQRVFFSLAFTALLLALLLAGSLLVPYERRWLLNVLFSCGFVAFVAIEVLYVIAAGEPHAGAADAGAGAGAADAADVTARLDCRSVLVLCFFVYVFPIEVGLSYEAWRASVPVIALLLLLAVSPRRGGGGSGGLSFGALSFVVALFPVMTFLPQRLLYLLQRRQHVMLRSLAEESRAQLVLLKRVIPDVFIEQLLDPTKRVTSEPIPNVTVLFCEVMVAGVDAKTGTVRAAKLGFDLQASTLSVLSAVFNVLERVVERNGVHKLETVFSEFVAVSGVPLARSHHANTTYAMLLTAVDMMREVREQLAPGGLLAEVAAGLRVDLQIGIHTGEVVESILGRRLLPRWKLFGDTVNMTSRMKSNGVFGRIHLSRAAKEHFMLDALPIAAHALLQAGGRNGTPSASASEAGSLRGAADSAARGAAAFVAGGSGGESAAGRQLRRRSDASGGAAEKLARLRRALDAAAAQQRPGAADEVPPAGAAPEQLAEPVSNAEVAFGRCVGFFLRQRPPMLIKGKGMCCTYLVDLCVQDAVAPALERLRRRAVGSAASLQGHARTSAFGEDEEEAADAALGEVLADEQAVLEELEGWAAVSSAAAAALESTNFPGGGAGGGIGDVGSDADSKHRADGAVGGGAAFSGFPRPKLHMDLSLLSPSSRRWLSMHDEVWADDRLQNLLLRRFNVGPSSRWGGEGSAVPLATAHLAARANERAAARAAAARDPRAGGASLTPSPATAAAAVAAEAAVSAAQAVAAAASAAQAASTAGSPSVGGSARLKRWTSTPPVEAPEPAEEPAEPSRAVFESKSLLSENFMSTAIAEAAWSGALVSPARAADGSGWALDEAAREASTGSLEKPTATAAAPASSEAPISTSKRRQLGPGSLLKLAASASAGSSTRHVISTVSPGPGAGSHAGATALGEGVGAASGARDLLPPLLAVVAEVPLSPPSATSQTLAAPSVASPSSLASPAPSAAAAASAAAPPDAADSPAAASAADDSVVAPELDFWTLRFVRAQASLESAFVAEHASHFRFSGVFAMLIVTTFVGVNSFFLLANFLSMGAAIGFIVVTFLLGLSVLLALSLHSVDENSRLGDPGSEKAAGGGVGAEGAASGGGGGGGGGGGNGAGGTTPRLWQRLGAGQCRRVGAAVVVLLTAFLLAGASAALLSSVDKDVSAYNLFTSPLLPEGSIRAGDARSANYAVLFSIATFVVLLVAPFYYGLLFRYYVGLAAAGLALLVTTLVLGDVREAPACIVWLALTLVASVRRVRTAEFRLRAAFLDHQLVEAQQARTRRMLHAMLPESIADEMIAGAGGADGAAKGEGDADGIDETPYRIVVRFARELAGHLRRLIFYTILGIDDETPGATATAPSSAAAYEHARKGAAYEHARKGADKPLPLLPTPPPPSAADVQVAVVAAGKRPVQAPLQPPQASPAPPPTAAAAAAAAVQPPPTALALQALPGSSPPTTTPPPPMVPSALASKTYEVSLLLFDLVGFTSLSADVGPSRIVELLDEMYTSFDRIVARRGARKIETIGDAFLVACGAPEAVDAVTSAATVAKCALDMLSAVQSFSRRFGPRLRGHKLQARIGIHWGRVLAGVIGTQMPRFQLFGAAVDDVQAIESSSEPGRVHASPQILSHLAAMRATAPPPAPPAAARRGGCCRGADAVAPEQVAAAAAAAAAVAAAAGPPATAQQQQRAVPDIKVVKRLADGSGFIERDRHGGVAQGVAW